MNKELLEKLKAVRQHLLALKAVATDVKKLVDFAQQKSVTLRLNYRELWPYMTAMQKSRATWLVIFEGQDMEHIAYAVTTMVPRMLADLDDLEREIQTNAALTPGGTSAAT
jgi:hypothetical protein